MPDLPSGTVTYCLTDIEGSTALWERWPAEMRHAVARHEVVAAATIKAHEGVLIHSRGEGDSLFVVFGRATHAVACARALQQAWVEEAWPAQTPLKVRIALHTGEAQLRDGDYYGSAVSRCARLREIAHGGQVVMSQTTYALVQDDPPEGIGFLDLGTHRLRDLARAETVWQLRHEGLPEMFPPLKSLDARPNNLPAPMTSFIGRASEVADIRQLMSQSRMLTLTGPGGVGKTRLALAVAADCVGQFSDGVWLTEMAALADPALVPPAVAAAVGVREDGLPALLDHLKRRSLLLMLDNCEHLLPACRALADEVLRLCPRVHVLATSREALGVPGEQAYLVPSLSLPTAGEAATLENFAQSDSVRLFVDRARLNRPDFALSTLNVKAVAQICRRLDGIPLAIELAASCVRALSAEQVAQRLHDRFRLLTGGSRTALPRQQTLHAAIDWSHNLLAEPERLLFRRLSVFSGGWTLEAAEAVCADAVLDAGEVLPRLAQLTEKSLVVYEDSLGRYRLPETVRQFSRDRLLESGDADALRGCHLACFAGLAQAASADLESQGERQGEWLDRLEAEHDNLRTALEWALGSAEPEGAVILAAHLWRFWDARGHGAEGLDWLDRALGTGAGTPQARAQALTGAGALAGEQGDGMVAQARHAEALALRREMGDERGVADSLNNLGNAAFRQGDLVLAHALLSESLEMAQRLEDRRGVASTLVNLSNVESRREDHEAGRARLSEALAIYQQLRDTLGTADVLNNLGVVAQEQGDSAAAYAFHAQGLALRRRMDDRTGIAATLDNLGCLAAQQSDWAVAQERFEEALTITRDLDHAWGIGTILRDLGDVARERGDGAKARAFYMESLAIHIRLGGRPDLMQCLESVAALAAREGTPAVAARLWGAAEAERTRLDLPRPPSERTPYEQAVAAARNSSPEASDAAWAAGGLLPLETAIAEAQTVVEASRADIR